MRTRFLRGTRDQNNGLTLPEGEISIDEETKAVRLHDGVTPGGFEIIGTRAYAPPMGHGSETLVAGDSTWGFYGEVASTDFITGDALASAIGLSAGTSQHNTSDWLKFASNGQVILVPKLTFRHSVSWEQIYQAGAVYGDDTNGSNPSGAARLQDAVVTVDGFDYRVRLLRGAGADPTVQGADGLWYGYDIDLSHGSEWNRLLYPIHSGVHTDANNPTTHSDPNATPFGSWASYSDADLLVHNSFGNGSYSWCQETNGDNTDNRVIRGYNGVSFFFRNTATATNAFYGWRPALELVV